MIARFAERRGFRLRFLRMMYARSFVKSRVTRENTSYTFPVDRVRRRVSPTISMMGTNGRRMKGMSPRRYVHRLVTWPPRHHTRT